VEGSQENTEAEEGQEDGHMLKRAWLTAICLITFAVGAAVSAQQSATLLFGSGERVSGEFVDMGADFTVRVNGETRHYSIHDVWLIDLVGGGQGLPNTELSAIPASGHLTILRGGESFTGRLTDISGTPMQFVFSTNEGERRINASTIGRVYLDRPNGNAVATTGSAPSGSGADQRTITVPANQQWVDTGLNVRQGEMIFFSPSGEIHFGPSAEHTAGPAGSTTGLIERRAPLPTALAGALIGRIGNGRPFGIGDQASIPMPATGRLFLGVNDVNFRDNSGFFTATISR
jgi:hypothetical protein